MIVVLLLLPLRRLLRLVRSVTVGASRSAGTEVPCQVGAGGMAVMGRMRSGQMAIKASRLSRKSLGFVDSSASGS